MRAATFAIVLAALLAGCTSPPIDAPPDAGAPEGGAVAAPEYRDGQTWNYTILNASGSRIGTAGYVVLRVESLGDAPAYRIREAIDAPTLGPPRTRERLYDLATLNEVVPGCDRTCASRGRELDFPLHDGKTWTDESRGDGARTMTATRLATGGDAGETWRITERRASCATCGEARTERDYAAEYGLVTDVRTYDAAGNVTQTWRLDEFDVA